MGLAPTGWRVSPRDRPGPLLGALAAIVPALVGMVLGWTGALWLTVAALVFSAVGLVLAGADRSLRTAWLVVACDLYIVAWTAMFGRWGGQLLAPWAVLAFLASRTLERPTTRGRVGFAAQVGFSLALTTIPWLADFPPWSPASDETHATMGWALAVACTALIGAQFLALGRQFEARDTSLLAAAERWEALSRLVPVALGIVDRAGTLSEVTGRLQAGWEVGASVPRFLGIDDRTYEDRVLPQAVAGAVEVHRGHGDSDLHAELSAVPLTDGRHLLTLTDAGERVRDRRAAEAAREVAMHAEGARQRFLNTMSHELRTPLAVLDGQIALMEDLRALGRHGDLVDEVKSLREAAARVRRPVEELLMLAESGRAAPAPRTARHPLKDVIARIASRRAGELKRRAGGFEWWVSPGAECLDGGPLEAAVDHALAFMLDHSLGATVQLAARTDGDRILVELRGKGLDPGRVPELRRAAVAFAELDTRDDREQSGLGSHLALVIRHADALAGHADLSAGGDGALLSIDVPAVRMAPASTSRNAAIVGAPEVEAMIARLAAQEAGWQLSEAPSIAALLGRRGGTLGLVVVELRALRGAQAEDLGRLREEQPGLRVLGLGSKPGLEVGETYARAIVDEVVTRPLWPAAFSGSAGESTHSAAPAASALGAALREELGEESVRELLAAFGASIQGALRDLEQAGADGVRAVAHRLRPAAEALGAEDTADLCRRIEEREAADETAVALLGQTLRDRLDEVRRGLPAQRGEL